MVDSHGGQPFALMQFVYTHFAPNHSRTRKLRMGHERSSHASPTAGTDLERCGVLSLGLLSIAVGAWTGTRRGDLPVGTGRRRPAARRVPGRVPPLVRRSGSRQRSVRARRRRHSQRGWRAASRRTPRGAGSPRSSSHCSGNCRRCRCADCSWSSSWAVCSRSAGAWRSDQKDRACRWAPSVRGSLAVASAAAGPTCIH